MPFGGVPPADQRTERRLTGALRVFPHGTAPPHGRSHEPLALDHLPARPEVRRVDHAKVGASRELRGNDRQVLGADQPVVKVDPGVNIAGRERMSMVAGSGEIITPPEPAHGQLLRLAPLLRVPPSLRDRPVAAAGVAENDLVDVWPESIEAGRDVLALVPGDHHH